MKSNKIHLDSFLTKNNLSIPPDYSEFLLKHNGEIKKDITIAVSEYVQIIINEVYGVNRSSNNLGLISCFDLYQNRLPENMIPIAEDVKSNLLCINNLNNKIFFLQEVVNSITQLYSFPLEPICLFNNFKQFYNLLQEQGAI